MGIPVLVYSLNLNATPDLSIKSSPNLRCSQVLKLIEKDEIYE